MHDEIDDLLPLYALDALDGDDLERLEAHMATGCAECARQLVDLERTTAALASAVPSGQPPARLRGRVMDAVAARPPAPHREPLPFRPRPQPGDARPGSGPVAAVAVLLAAAAIACVFLGSLLISTRSSLENEVRRVADLRAANEKKDEQLSRAKRVLDVVNDPAVRYTRLSTTGAQQEPGVSVLWSPNNKSGLLYAKSLPKVEPDKTYELWLIADSGPVPAALFNTGADGTAVVEIGSLPVPTSPQKFAVTVEPAGGSKLPTTTPILAGEYGA